MNGSIIECPASAPPRVERRGRVWLLLTGGCRYLLGAVFLMAAVSKITDLRGFEEHLLEAGYLPGWLASGVARLLPWLELVCGFCLLTGLAAREAALIVSVLLPLFLSHFALSQQDSCGCLLSPLPAPGLAGWWPALRDVILLLCAGLVLASGRRQPAGGASGGTLDQPADAGRSS
jgi:uncharacterized membrane protein YphA (DoxX/SURF4 family)